MPGVYQQFPFWFTQSSFCEGNSPLITRHRIQVLSFQTLAHSFAFFCTHQKRNSFIFKRFRTLCAKTPGGGYPSPRDFFVRGPFVHEQRNTHEVEEVRTAKHSQAMLSRIPPLLSLSVPKSLTYDVRQDLNSRRILLQKRCESL